jgi:hypothetical protein
VASLLDIADVCFEGLEQRSANGGLKRELLGHVATSQPGGKSPRLEAPLRGVFFRVPTDTDAAPRNGGYEARRLGRSGVGWNQPGREASFRILLYRLGGWTARHRGPLLGTP